MGYLHAYKKRAVGFGLETIQNTPVALAATDFLDAMDFTVTPNLEQIANDVVRPALGTAPSIVGKISGGFTAQAKWRGAGSVGSVLSPFNALMLMAGATGSVQAGVRVRYTPQSNPFNSNFQTMNKSGTVIGNYHGVQFQLAGAAASIKFSGQAGSPFVMDITGQGLYSTPTDTVLPTVNYNGGTVAPAWKSGTISFGGVSTLMVSAFEFDLGAVVQQFDDAQAADGIGIIGVMDRAPVGSFTALLTSVADFDTYGKLKAGTLTSGSVVVGTVAGNKLIFTFPGTMQFTQVGAPTNINGAVAVQVTYALRGTSDNEWTIDLE